MEDLFRFVMAHQFAALVVVVLVLFAMFKFSQPR